MTTDLDDDSKGYYNREMYEGFWHSSPIPQDSEGGFYEESKCSSCGSKNVDIKFLGGHEGNKIWQKTCKKCGNCW